MASAYNVVHFGVKPLVAAKRCPPSTNYRVGVRTGPAGKPTLLYPRAGDSHKGPSVGHAFRPPASRVQVTSVQLITMSDPAWPFVIEIQAAVEASEAGTAIKPILRVSDP